MKNYDDMTRDLLERRDEYVEKQKIKRKNVAYVASSLCGFCFIALLCFGIFQLKNPNSPPQDQTINDALYPGIEDTFDDKNGESDKDPSRNEKVVVNVLEENFAATDVPFLFPQKINGIALMKNDFVEMSQQELTAYYGINYIPEVSADLNQLSDNRNHGIFKRNGGIGEVYWDADIIRFTNEDETRSLYLQVYKETVVNMGNICFQVENEVSTINNWKVMIGSTKDGSYCAEFVYKKIHFLVFAYGLTENEFLAALSSLII